MTVTNTAFQSTFTGDGATVAFSFTWRITETQMLAVYVNGVLKTLGVDYTFTNNINTTGLGGTVTFTTAPALNAAVVLQRSSDQLQNNSLVNNQAMPPATIMAMVDKLTILLQDALRKFTSADTVIAASQTYTFPHLLGRIPSSVETCLVCQTTDGGYAAGDVVDVAESGTVLMTATRDITNIVVRFGTATTLSVVSKVNAPTTISPFANWKLRVYAS